MSNEDALGMVRTKLCAAAMEFKGSGDAGSVETLCRRAVEYAQEREKLRPRVGPSAQTKEAHGMTLPFGRAKGVKLAEADTRDLRWTAGVVRESIDDPAKERWRAQNVELLEAIDRELATR
jgi:hypothetical protein